MQDKFSFAVLSPEAERRASIARGLEAPRGPEASGTIRVVADADSPEGLEAALQGAARVAVYVDLEGEPEKGLAWIEAAPDARVPIVAGGPEDPALILRAMRAGALGYFPGHVFDDELARITRRLREQAAAEAPAAAGHVIAVLGAKGGVGATTVACELAASLAKRSARVALLDAKAYFGDVALHLDVTPAYTLADVAARSDDLDATFLATVAHRHPASGVHVVAAPADPEEADGIEASLIERSVSLLRAEFDWVVVDLPRITEEASLHVIDKADQLVLVTTSDVPSLVRAKQHCTLLDQLGVGDDKRRVVVNRTTRPGLLTDQDPARAIGLDPIAYVPDDADAIEASIAAGRPAALSSGNAVAPVLGELARQAHAWCDAEWVEATAPAPQTLTDRIQAVRERALERAADLAKELRCRLANG